MKIIFGVILFCIFLFADNIQIVFWGGMIDNHKPEKVLPTYLNISEGQRKEVCLNGDIIKNQCFYIEYRPEGIYFNIDLVLGFNNKTGAFIENANWNDKPKYKISIVDFNNDLSLKNINVIVKKD